MIHSDRRWRDSCAAAGLPDLVPEYPRFEARATRAESIDPATAMLGRVLAERTAAERVRIPEETAEPPVAPAHTPESVVHDPHPAASGLFAAGDRPVEVRLLRVAPAVRFCAGGGKAGSPRPTPRLGDHGEGAPHGAGRSEDGVAALVGGGAVRGPG